MLNWLNKGRKVILRAIIIRIVVSMILNTALSFSAGDCAFPVDTGFNREQLRNYQEQDTRIRRIINLVFPDMDKAQKDSWAMLLLGTAAVESNFLDRYSGVSINGSGPYQVIGKTVYGVIHSYISYPVKDTGKIAKREELIPLFARVTDRRVTWAEIINMDMVELKNLCVKDHDFAALVSLLVYKDIFERKNIYHVPSEPSGLALLWKRYYNTEEGAGTEKRFIRRFMCLHAYLV